MCGVDHEMVDRLRPDQVAESASSTRTGQDGKERPAHPRKAEAPDEGETGPPQEEVTKRRCVELALREFPGKSSRAYAEMCGVSDMFVGHIRPVQTDCTDTRTGRDGKEQVAKHKRAERPGDGETDQCNATVRNLHCCDFA